MPDTATFRATEELYRIAKFIMAYAVCDAGSCSDCDFLRDITRNVLAVIKKIRESDDGK